MTFQRPLNSSISAMSLRNSGVIVMLVMRCMAGTYFHPFIAVSHPITGKYPFSPIYSHSAERAKARGRSAYHITRRAGLSLKSPLISLPTFVPVSEKGLETLGHRPSETLCFLMMRAGVGERLAGFAFCDGGGTPTLTCWSRSRNYSHPRRREATSRGGPDRPPCVVPGRRSPPGSRRSAAPELRCGPGWPLECWMLKLTWGSYVR
jgi:hypothetical protein